MATKDGLAIDRVFKKIRDIISRSHVPEDPLHAEDTLKILLELYPEADMALRLSAFAHDIERAYPKGVRVERGDFSSYDAFKRGHACNSGRILKGLLARYGVSSSIVSRVFDLVASHEFGGTFAADLLMDADSLSFFHVNLSLYMEREPMDEVLRRVRWGLGRLSPRARKFLSLRLLGHMDPLIKDILVFEGVHMDTRTGMPCHRDG